MGFHHVALATHDTAETHRFYTEAMGFELVKTVVAPVPGSATGGWSKHFFYDTGSRGMIAFWELHDEALAGAPTNLNDTAGLPGWVNHFAYDAPTREFLDERRAAWCAYGRTVVEVNHEFCVSIYTTDPDGNTVEFCHDLREFTPEEKARAHELLADPSPAMDKDATITLWPPTGEPVRV
jgi:catechol 2,3-dioxygenase-like lactoylglutathione lyase family enzyme